MIIALKKANIVKVYLFGVKNYNCFKESKFSVTIIALKKANIMKIHQAI